MSLRPLCFAAAVVLAAAAFAQDPSPGTRPMPQPEDEILRPLLPTGRARPPVLLPIPDQPIFDETTQKMVLPRPPELTLVPEGVVKVDRLGRLTRNADKKPEFVFEPDPEAPVQAQLDLPMIVLPSRLLAAMETYLQQKPDAWFRVSFRVTSYYPRNYMLIEAATPTTQPTTRPSADRQNDGI